MSLDVAGLKYRAGSTEILHDVDLEVREGEFVGLIGPNGSGKSTTIKCISRIHNPTAGTVHLNGRSVASLSATERAREMAVVGQESVVRFDFTVEEIVMMGRAPHKRMFESDGESDREIVSESLRKVGMGSFRNRSYLTLSGGEKQRVLIARCLAQQADTMLLDEPTNHLDVRYRMDILDLLHRLEPSVLIAIHDLNAAAQYCDRIYVMDDGEIVASGPPGDVLEAERIEGVFGRSVDVREHPRTGRPHLLFYSEKETAKE